MRLRDNPALLRASEGAFSAVVPVYIHDEADGCPHPLRGAALVCKHESLRVFAATLAGIGSGLIFRRGDAVEELRAVLAAVQGTDARPTRVVLFNHRLEPWHRHRDGEVARALEASGIRVESFSANALYDPEDLQPIERWQRWRARVRAEEAQARGAPPGSKALSGTPKAQEHISGFGSYRFFHHALEELGDPPQPCRTVSRLPPCPASAARVSLQLEDLGYGASHGRAFTASLRQCGSGRGSDWAAAMRLYWPFGEREAVRRMEEFLEAVLAPGDFEGRQRLRADRRGTSELSPYIRLGEISARTVYWAARRRKERTDQRLFNEPQHAGLGRANATFLRRFVWRDLSYWFLSEFPNLPETSMRVQYETQVWSGTASQLQRWRRGTTGFPLVDAAMRQLWAIGWMPNYLRHVVAQTLIEYMDITWKEGLKWFEWTLVDADVAINSFMWQNGGHSGPDQWEFVLHPVHAAKTCDPDGAYVRRWVPELAALPTEYIHRPWDFPGGPARMPALQGYPGKAVEDLDGARRMHAAHVIDVRKRHPHTISRTGHEWLQLPGRPGLLAKLVTRDEFRAETQDFIFRQTPGRVGRQAAAAPQRRGRGTQEEAMADLAGGQEL